MFSKKATKIDEIFTIDFTLCNKRQIDGEDFVNFRGLLRKCEIYCALCQFEKNIPLVLKLLSNVHIF